MITILVAQLSIEAERRAMELYRVGYYLRTARPSSKASSGWLDATADADIYDTWAKDFERRQAAPCNDSSVSIFISEVA